MLATSAETSAPPRPEAAPPPVAQGGPLPQAPGPKRRRGCLVIALVVVLLLCLCCAGGALGLSLFAKPRDLGVTFTEADYWRALEKAGVEVSGMDASGEVEAAEVVYEGSIPLDQRFTAAEMSALVSYSHMPGWPVHDTQVRFNEGGNLEVSGYATWRGAEYSFYIDADASLSGRTLSGSVNEARVFWFAATPEMIAQGEPVALGIINDRLARLGGLDVVSAEVVDGELRLRGTVPAKVSVVTP